MNVTTCQKCNAAIRFVEMASGKKMPVDVVPNREKGNVYVHNGLGRVLSGDDLARARAEGTPLFLSHFGSCPAAPSFRKGKAKAK